MKKIIFIFIITAFVLSCSSSNTSSTQSNTSSTSSELKVIKWGPEDGKVGTIPNKQPTGQMGIWIEVTPTESFGEAVVLFDGHPVPTSTEPRGITGGVSPEDLVVPGDKKIEIKQVSTGKIIPVGTFKLLPEK